LQPNTLDGEGPKPKPLTRPQCSRLLKTQAKELVVDISLDMNDDEVNHMLEFFPKKNTRRNKLNLH